MAGKDLPHSPETETSQNRRARHFLEEAREMRGLTWNEVAQEMGRLFNVSYTGDYLQKIKRGAAPLSKMALDGREALRGVLGISPDRWQEETGLYTPPPVPEELRRSPPVPPVVEPVIPPLDIPPELQQVIDEHGDQYPQLHDETVLRALTAPRMLLGDGPQTADQWRSYFFMNLPFLKKEK